MLVIALIIQGSENGSLDGKILPEPPTSNYYVGFSCLDTTSCVDGDGTCGVYFKELIKNSKMDFLDHM